jgi:hypothetical protein
MMHRKPHPGLACGVFELGHSGDARSLTAFAVDGCVSMSKRCRLCRTATTSRCPAPRTGIWGAASLGRRLDCRASVDVRQSSLLFRHRIGPKTAFHVSARCLRAEACLFGLCEVGTSALPKRGAPLSRPIGRVAIQRTHNGPGARNPQSPPAHDASRSPRSGGTRRIGLGRRGGDKFRRCAARCFPQSCSFRAQPGWVSGAGSIRMIGTSGQRA